MSHSHSVMAAKQRKEKEEHAGRFCRRGTCLFRVLRADGVVVPCPKHGPRARTPETPEEAARAERGREVLRRSREWNATHTTADVQTIVTNLPRPGVVTTSDAGAAFAPEQPAWGIEATTPYPTGHYKKFESDGVS